MLEYVCVEIRKLIHMYMVIRIRIWKIKIKCKIENVINILR